MSPETRSILSRIKSIEVQVTALKTQLLELGVNTGEAQTHTFADLYGRLAGQAESSEADIDAVLYHSPSDPHSLAQ